MNTRDDQATLSALISAARDVSCSLEPPFCLDDVRNPDWSVTRKVHNWRTHIPEAIRSVWSALPIEAKLCAFIQASEGASQELWD
jgi:hypothetical protein